MESLEEQVSRIQGTIRRLRQNLSYAERLQQDKPENIRRVSDTIGCWEHIFLPDEFSVITRVSVCPLVDTFGEARFETALTYLSGVAGQISEAALQGCKMLDEILENYLFRLERFFERGDTLEDITQADYRQIRDRIGSTLIRLKQMKAADRLDSAASAAEESAEQTKNARDTARTAAGATSEFVLSGEFATLAKEESATAGKYRAATISLIAIGIVATAVLHLVARDPDLGTAVYNLAIVAAVFGLSGYLGRQSGHHREISVWAKTIQVQLLTFEAFLEPITDPAARDQARLAFASRVFGSAPTAKGEEIGPPSPQLFEQLLSLAARGGSSK